MSERPTPPEPGPSDLGPHEARIADWLSGAESRRPPPELEETLLEAYASALRPQGAWSRPGSWVGAVGAVLLVGLGLGVLAWVADGAAKGVGPGATEVPREPAIVVDDPSVPLYSGIESFDSPDAAPDVVIPAGSGEGNGGAPGVR